ncbi:hypothetical protein [Psychrobacter sp. I-STPA10]|uniref:hypothetical protein n=1 Tax=Psychrobacter sp. I-STPA10 TaxID=2585769 RepID=UPI001E53566F|nr:hypothetical protein [Psychrobacter sp. I-STPA10]
MNIEQMSVAIRPMTTSQAVDLGVMMARHWFLPLWKIWLGMALPFFILFYLGSTLLQYYLAVPASDAWWWLGGLGGIIFWWLKPLYEKPMLSWLGFALFSNPPSVKSTIKQGWLELKKHAFTLLIARRFSLSRQLMLPILILENPEKSQFKSRFGLLLRGQGSGLAWHTIVMLHIEMIFTIGMLLFLLNLIPTTFMSAETFFTYLEVAPTWTEILWITLYFFSISIVAPFFIAGGFAVYLTKRCLLEGWDVELVFKRLKQRYLHSQQSVLLFDTPLNNHLNNHNLNSDIAHTIHTPSTSANRHHGDRL